MFDSVRDCVRDCVVDSGVLDTRLWYVWQCGRDCVRDCGVMLDKAEGVRF